MDSPEPSADPPMEADGWSDSSDPPAETDGWSGSPEPPVGTAAGRVPRTLQQRQTRGQEVQRRLAEQVAEQMAELMIELNAELITEHMSRWGNMKSPMFSSFKNTGNCLQFF